MQYYYFAKVVFPPTNVVKTSCDKCLKNVKTVSYL